MSSKRYTDEEKAAIVEKVCDRIVEGESVRRIMEDPDMPVRHMFYQWIRANDEFKRKYREAKEAQAWGFDDQMRDSFDEEVNPINRLANGAYDSAHVTHVNNRVRYLQWLAAKHAPKVYGDLVKIAGDDEQAPIRISDAEAQHKIAAILAGAKVRKSADDAD